MQSDIKLAKLKEGVDSVVVQELLVGPGQAIEKDQALMTVNADKSTFDVKAPMAGKLVKFAVKVDDEIKIGATYCVIDGANGAVPALAKEAPRLRQSPPRHLSRRWVSSQLVPRRAGWRASSASTSPLCAAAARMVGSRRKT